MVSVGDPPVVAQVVRNGFVESSHRGIVVITRADGSVSYARGDYDSDILPRSSLKPIQALAMVRCGLDLPSEQLAIACASHSGEPMHLKAVQGILEAAGLQASDLSNTPDLPLIDEQRNEWIATGRAPSSAPAAASIAAITARRTHRSARCNWIPGALRGNSPGTRYTAAPASSNQEARARPSTALAHTWGTSIPAAHTAPMPVTATAIAISPILGYSEH